MPTNSAYLHSGHDDAYFHSPCASPLMRSATPYTNTAREVKEEEDFIAFPEDSDSSSSDLDDDPLSVDRLIGIVKSSCQPSSPVLQPGSNTNGPDRLAEDGKEPLIVKDHEDDKEEEGEEVSVDVAALFKYRDLLRQRQAAAEMNSPKPVDDGDSEQPNDTMDARAWMSEEWEKELIRNRDLWLQRAAMKREAEAGQQITNTSSFGPESTGSSTPKVRNQQQDDDTDGEQRESPHDQDDYMGNEEEVENSRPPSVTTYTSDEGGYYDKSDKENEPDRDNDDDGSVSTARGSRGPMSFGEKKGETVRGQSGSHRRVTDDHGDTTGNKPSVDLVINDTPRGRSVSTTVINIKDEDAQDLNQAVGSAERHIAKRKRQTVPFKLPTGAEIIDIPSDSDNEEYTDSRSRSTIPATAGTRTVIPTPKATLVPNALALSLNLDGSLRISCNVDNPPLPAPVRSLLPTSTAANVPPDPPSNRRSPTLIALPAKPIYSSLEMIRERMKWEEEMDWAVYGRIFEMAKFTYNVVLRDAITDATKVLYSYMFGVSPREMNFLLSARQRLRKLDTGVSTPKADELYHWPEIVASLLNDGPRHKASVVTKAQTAKLKAAKAAPAANVAKVSDKRQKSPEEENTPNKRVRLDVDSEHATPQISRPQVSSKEFVMGLFDQLMDPARLVNGNNPQGDHITNGGEGRQSDTPTDIRPRTSRRISAENIRLFQAASRNRKHINKEVHNLSIAQVVETVYFARALYKSSSSSSGLSLNPHRQRPHITAPPSFRELSEADIPSLSFVLNSPCDFIMTREALVVWEKILLFVFNVRSFEEIDVNIRCNSERGSYSIFITQVIIEISERWAETMRLRRR